MSGAVEVDDVLISSGGSSFACTLASANRPKLPMTSIKTDAVIQFVVCPAFLILAVVIFLTLSSICACGCKPYRM